MLVVGAAAQLSWDSPALTAVAADAPAQKTSFPVIVSTTPKVGEIDVDPALKEVTVTFDRDMSDGMSWTGGGPMFPADESQKATWKDSRTCVLPVTLKKGKAYRIGINSKSFQNFRSKDGEPTPPSAITFATDGATTKVKQQIMVPKIVTLIPSNDATGVDPAIKELTVTFDIPMGEGMSWTGGGETFPTLPEGRKATWSKDHRTCTLPVTLKSGHTYKLGLNSLKFINFQSASGVPLEPVNYTFTTR